MSNQNWTRRFLTFIVWNQVDCLWGLDSGIVTRKHTGPGLKLASDCTSFWDCLEVAVLGDAGAVVVDSPAFRFFTAGSFEPFRAMRGFDPSNWDVQCVKTLSLHRVEGDSSVCDPSDSSWKCIFQVQCRYFGRQIPNLGMAISISWLFDVNFQSFVVHFWWRLKDSFINRIGIIHCL